MIHRRGKGRESIPSGRTPVLDCPLCACPNRPGAAKCIYCGSALPSAGPKSGLPYIDDIRKFFDGSSRKKRSPLWKSSASALLSTLLLALGVHFFIRAVGHGGYFNWAAVLLLGFYAAALLRNAYLLLFDKKLD